MANAMLQLNSERQALPRKILTQRDLKFRSDKRNGTIGDHIEAVLGIPTRILRDLIRTQPLADCMCSSWRGLSF